MDLVLALELEGEPLALAVNQTAVQCQLVVSWQRRLRVPQTKTYKTIITFGLNFHNFNLLHFTKLL